MACRKFINQREKWTVFIFIIDNKKEMKEENKGREGNEEREGK